MQILSEILEPMQDKNAIFTIGRFQPPSSGHYKMINKMKLFIREHSDLKLTPIIVIIEGEKSSQDKKRNPLTGEDRIKFLKASGHCDGFKFILAKNGFIAAGLIRQLGYEPRVIAGGSDRADGYLKHLDKDFKTPDDKPIEHFIVPGLERVDSSVLTKKSDKSKALDDAIAKMSAKEKMSDDEVSGSLARHVAELGYPEEFSEIVGLTHKPKLAKMLYDKIRTAMGVE